MQFCSVTEAPVEVRAEGDRRTILGRAATFNSLSHDLGGYREKINARAFDRTLDDVAAGRNHVSARIQHDGGLSIVGTTKNGSLRLFKDAAGLNYELTALPDTQSARDLLTLVQGGYINKSSFAFTVPDRANGMRWDYTTNPPTRELLDVDLVDVAPVDGPAYEATSVEARALALASMREAGQAVDLYMLDEVMPTWMSRYLPDGVSSGKVIEALAAVPDAKQINVIINSPGGDVFEANTIYNTLKQHPAPVNVEIRGLAASAAGIIAMAGDTITMGEGSYLMVHNAWTVAQGNASQLRDTAVFLDRIDADLTGILASRSGNDIDQMKQWMAAETWFTADEAIAAGFADRKMGEAENIDGERCRALNYRNIPADLGGVAHIETRAILTADDIMDHTARELKRAF
jgi:ATP-dependent Clp protease protease subunit